jgi:pimeloyl-ACP methyl ester carboxylesterase
MRNKIHAAFTVVLILGQLACAPHGADSQYETVNSGSKSATTTIPTAGPTAPPSGLSVPPSSDGSPVSAQLITSIPFAKVVADGEQAGLPSAFLNRLANGDVKVYKLEYWTRDVYDAPIVASGVALVPVKRLDSPVALYMHGTVTASTLSDVPSVGTSGEIKAMAAIAAQGYIVLAPDYIGYGSSRASEHPYLHVNSMVKSTNDFVLAAETQLAQIGSSPRWSAGLYIAGYSQGAHAGMALHRAFEQSGRYKVAVSVLGAGPYDPLQTVREAMKKTSTPFSEVYVWGLASLLRSIQRADLLPLLFAPAHAQLNPADFLLGATSAPRDFRSLFSQDVVASILSDGSSIYRNLLQAQHSYEDWTPQAPLRLFHGRNDDLVSREVTEEAVRQLRARGASVLSLSNREQHISAIPRYFVEVSLQFAAIRTGRPGFRLASEAIDTFENTSNGWSVQRLLNGNMGLIFSSLRSRILAWISEI